MSSLLAAVARGVPKVANLVVGSGVAARATRVRNVRMLSSFPLSAGLFGRPSSSVHHRSNTTTSSSNSCSKPAQRSYSALAVAVSARPQLHPPQQLRLLGSESNSNNLDDEAPGAEAVWEEGMSVQGEEQASPDGDEPISFHASDAALNGAPREQPRAETKSINQIQVDGIPYSTTEEGLHKWFSDAGCVPIKLTLMMRSLDSIRAGLNKGRATVEFADEDDTLTALRLTGDPMGDRWVHIHRLSTIIEECCKITIKGLQDIPEHEISDMFQNDAGVVPKTITITNHANRPSGLAFAEFNTPAETQKALSLDGMHVLQRWIDLSPLLVNKMHDNPPQVNPTASAAPFGKNPEGVVMMLKGLPFFAEEKDIMSFLVQKNLSEDDIKSLNLPKHNSTKFNTGVAFFLLENEEVVQKALELKGAYLGERWIDVLKWSIYSTNPKMSSKHDMDAAAIDIPIKLKEKHTHLPCVVVSGLPFHKSKDEFLKYLEAQGVLESTISEVEMPLFLHTKNNTGKCWLVINEEEAYNRTIALNGAIMDDRWITVADT